MFSIPVNYFNSFFLFVGFFVGFCICGDFFWRGLCVCVGWVVCVCGGGCVCVCVGGGGLYQIFTGAYLQYIIFGKVLFNNALNTFYLWLYGIKHMVKDHSYSERANLLLPHWLLFLISSKDSFKRTIPDRIPHTMAFVTVMEHCLDIIFFKSFLF